MLTQETLKQLLHYDPETGLFTWLVSRQGVRLGKPAGWTSNGYVMITIDGNAYGAHRLAWLYVHGKWPNNEIDHDNGNRSDNRIVNLFDKTHAENLQSFQRLRPATRGKSGFRGVTWNARAKGWVGQYMRNGVSTFCGVHNSPEKAYTAIQASKAGLPAMVRMDPRIARKRLKANGWDHFQSKFEHS